MKRKSLITLVLGTALAVASAANAQPMVDSSGAVNDTVVVHTDVLGGNGAPAQATATATTPYGMSEAEYQAVLARGQGLNERYGNAVTHLSAQQFKSLYTAGGDSIDPQELAASVARGEALNTQYGANGPSVTLQTDTLGGNGGVSTTPTSAPISSSDGDSIVWNAALGAGALLGAMALVLAFATMSRRRHRLGF